MLLFLIRTQFCQNSPFQARFGYVSSRSGLQIGAETGMGPLVPAPGGNVAGSMSTSVLPPNAWRSTRHAPPATARHQRPNCQRSKGPDLDERPHNLSITQNLAIRAEEPVLFPPWWRGWRTVILGRRSRPGLLTSRKNRPRRWRGRESLNTRGGEPTGRCGATAGSVQSS